MIEMIVYVFIVLTLYGAMVLYSFTRFVKADLGVIHYTVLSDDMFGAILLAIVWPIGWCVLAGRWLARNPPNTWTEHEADPNTVDVLPPPWLPLPGGDQPQLPPNMILPPMTPRNPHE